MAYTPPTVSEFKAFFTRDFPYGSTTDVVMDGDITRALSEAYIGVDESLWGDNAEYQLAYLYLAAHNLVENLRASSQGIAGQYSWIESSKSVGSVSQSFSIPDNILKNPTYAMLSKTSYGAKFLEMMLPRIIGNSFTVCGRTHA